MKILMIIILFSSFALAQVNTESVRKDFGKNTWTNSIYLDAVLKGGNTEFFDGNIQFRTDLKFTSNYTFLVANYNYKDGFTKILERKGFVHLRYNYIFNPRYTFEAFFQNEFNQFQRLTFRSLLGSGTRIRLFDSNKDSLKFTAFLGNGFMLEDEELFGSNRLPLVTRSTNYLSLLFKVNDNISFISVSYFQFRLDKLSDHRLLNDTRLEIKLSKHLSFVSALDYRFDSSPALEVKKFDYEFRNGIRFEF